MCKMGIKKEPPGNSGGFRVGLLYFIVKKKKAGALRPGLHVLFAQEYQYPGYDFILQPPLCGGAVHIDHGPDIDPVTAPDKAPYDNLGVIRGEPRKADCPAQFFLRIGFQFGIFVIGSGGTVCTKQQFLGFTAALIRPPWWILPLSHRWRGPSFRAGCRSRRKLRW